MSSIQALPRQSQASSTRSTMRTLVFLGVSYRENDKTILRELKNQNRDIEDVSRLYLQNGAEELTNAIRIDFKSNSSATEFLNKGVIQISNTSYSIQSSKQSVFVSKVIVNDKAKLLQDLNHNYLAVDDARRFLDINQNPVDILRIDFKSATATVPIFKNDYILIDGKRCPVQALSSLVYDSSRNKEAPAVATPQQPVPKNSPKPTNGHTQKPIQSHWQKPTNGHSQSEQQLPVFEQPARYLTEERVKELFQQQQMQLESMINGFENKWNARLASLSAASMNEQVDQLSPVFQELQTVCQQFSQQNAQMQRQLGAVVNQVQNVRTKLSNDPNEQTWPKPSSQNGH